MKSVTIRDLQKSLKNHVDISQKDRVVVTRNGHPAAVIVGVEGMDWEDVFFATSPSFWRMIQKRRSEPTISFQEMERRLKLRKRN